MCLTHDAAPYDATPLTVTSFRLQDLVSGGPPADPDRFAAIDRPTLVVDRSRAERNIARMAAKAAASQLELAAQEAGVIAKKKSSQPVRGTGAWDDAMVKARGQAERYVRALPANEPNPAFLLVVDVGHSIEVFADFT